MTNFKCTCTVKIKKLYSRNIRILSVIPGAAKNKRLDTSKQDKEEEEEEEEEEKRMTIPRSDVVLPDCYVMVMEYLSD